MYAIFMALLAYCMQLYDENYDSNGVFDYILIIVTYTYLGLIRSQAWPLITHLDSFIILTSARHFFEF